MAKLDGKVALITGAAAGLGEGISTAYAKYRDHHSCCKRS